ncbi:MAG: hypothetical protein HWN66_18800, partial [Candidatus Helarchaeota archaeon]|nr:hypothetical protein [Candidatus Helarchaeota archaeon]
MARIDTRATPVFNIEESARIDEYQGQVGEAESLANLYKKTYNVHGDYLNQLRYPYPEVFDPEWIHITASDRNVVWKVVRDT